MRFDYPSETRNQVILVGSSLKSAF